MPKSVEFEVDDMLQQDIEALCDAADNWAAIRNASVKRQLLEAAITFSETLRSRKPKESILQRWHKEEGN